MRRTTAPRGTVLPPQLVQWREPRHQRKLQHRLTLPMDLRFRHRRSSQLANRRRRRARIAGNPDQLRRRAVHPGDLGSAEPHLHPQRPVGGSYVYIGVPGTGTTDTSTWTPGASGFQTLSVSFTTGASMTSVTVYAHGWCAEPAYYADGISVQ
jgi:hypothetical protein